MERFIIQSQLEKIYLDENNLRAQNGEKILKAICTLKHLKVLSLNNNFLGQALKNEQAPICILANLLITSVNLKVLDIGHNGIEGKTIYCLSEALVINKSLEHLSMDGNPLGKVGLALLMQARTRNTEQAFSISIKLAEGETDSAADHRIKIFDKDKPEGAYSFDLTKIYDQLCLQHILTLS